MRPTSEPRPALIVTLRRFSCATATTARDACGKGMSVPAEAMSVPSATRCWRRAAHVAGEHWRPVWPGLRLWELFRPRRRPASPLQPARVFFPGFFHCAGRMGLHHRGRGVGSVNRFASRTSSGPCRPVWECHRAMIATRTGPRGLWSGPASGGGVAGGSTTPLLIGPMLRFVRPPDCGPGGVLAHGAEFFIYAPRMRLLMSPFGGY